jgi:hypothetical protein
MTLESDSDSDSEAPKKKKKKKSKNPKKKTLSPKDISKQSNTKNKVRKQTNSREIRCSKKERRKRRALNEEDYRFRCPAEGCQEYGLIRDDVKKHCEAAHPELYDPDKPELRPKETDFLPLPLRHVHDCEDGCTTCPELLRLMKMERERLRALRQQAERARKFHKRKRSLESLLKEVVDLTKAGEHHKSWETVMGPDSSPKISRDTQIKRIQELNLLMNEKLLKIHEKYKIKHQNQKGDEQAEQPDASAFPQELLEVMRSWVRFDPPGFFEAVLQTENKIPDDVLEMLTNWDEWKSQFEKDPDLLWILKMCLNMSDRDYETLYYSTSKQDVLDFLPRPRDVSSGPLDFHFLFSFPMFFTFLDFCDFNPFSRCLNQEGPLESTRPLS